METRIGAARESESVCVCVEKGRKKDVLLLLDI